MRFFPLLVALTACTHVTRIRVEGPGSPKADVDVAMPQFLADHAEGDPFRTNTVVGNLTFSGGYVTESSGSGMYNVSKEVSTDGVDPYREQVITWLQGTLGTLVPLSDPPPPPRRTDQRGTDRRDGRDNVSLPRVALAPVPGGTFDRPTVVPWVVTYASHNAGWFYGQEFGTGAGARIRVLLVAHDTDGRVLGWTDVDGSRVSERVFSPTGPQLQDLLIALEERVGKRLARAAP